MELVVGSRKDAFPKGVTAYGTADQIEDYAESIMLYLAGIMGTATFRGNDLDEPVWFRDLFPERAAVLDQLFPDFARRQRALIEQIRQRPVFRRWAAVPANEGTRDS